MKKQNVFAHLFSYMGRFKITMVLSIILAAVAAVLNLSAFVCVYNVGKEIVQSLGDFTRLNQTYMKELGWQAVFLISASFGTYGFSLLFSHITAFNTVAKIRIHLVEHIGQLPLGYHSANPSGKQRKIIEKNTDNMETLISHQIPDLVQSAVLPIAFLVFMFRYDWRLSFICLLPILLGFMVLAAMLKGTSEGLAKQYQKSAEDISNAATEYVRGISVVKVFGQTASSFRRYKTAVKEYSDYVIKYAFSMENSDSIYNTVINGIFFFLIPGGIILFNASRNPERMILSFIFFAVLIPAVVTILNRIMKSSSNMMVASSSLDAIEKILAEQSLPQAAVTKQPDSYNITLDHVSFAYEDGAEKALTDVSLTIGQGTVTALVGESGGGKSTIANLIARFWDVQSGSVKVGGVDVRNMDYNAWMEQVSIVFQDTNLFKMSIADNVAFYTPGASRNDILRALHLAQCDDILEKLPDGADTVIGTKGVYLSGGEMQRISLARAILKDAPVVLLDEATAFADAENEHLIQKALDELLRGKTVLMIAHRLSTVIHADQICVLERGAITEKGTHDELLKKMECMPICSGNTRIVFHGGLEEEKMLKKLFHLSADGSKAVMKASLCMTIFNLSTLLPVILLAMVANEMLNCYFGDSKVKVPLWSYWGISLALIIIIFLTYRLTYHKKYYTSGKEDMRLRMELADKIRKLPLSYLEKRDLSDLTSVIMDDVATTANTLANTLTELISGICSGMIALILLFLYNWHLALSLAACLPLAVIAMSLCKFISEGTNKKNKQNKLAISDGLQEYLENIKVLRTSQKMEDYQKALAVKIKRIIPGLVLHELLAGLSISVSYNVMRIGLGFVIISGSLLLASGEISLITFLLFLFMAVRIYEPLTKSCEMFGEMIYSLVSAKRIRDLLDIPEQTGEENVQINQFDISFDNVSFGYNQEDVIHNVSFTAKQGEITALVGPSGCGKSTLCKLAARFHDVEHGNVRIGEINVKDVAPEILFKNYSIVFQDVVLFNDTIYNNIKIGREDATKDEVMEAAKLARCDEFIERLPMGYDTVIGENGKTLSGGERQRLSIARAFLKDAPVILLDESTASIDPENETKIQEAIGKLIENKTVLIIAHKLRSIVECDKIIVLKEGRLVEEGTHAELMKLSGLYHRLYALQNESMEWAVKA